MKKKSILLRLIRETKPIAGWLGLGAVLDVLSVVAAVVTPRLLGGIIQRICDYWEAGCQGQLSILPGLLTLLLAYAAASLLSYLNMLLMNNVVSRFFTCNIRIRISEKIKRLPVRYVDQTPVGDILSRMTQDVSEMGGYVHQIFDILVKGVFQLLLITGAMLWEDWRLAVFVVLLMPLSMMLSARISSVSEKYYDAMFERSGKLTEIVEESFSNYSTTKAYHLEETVCRKHETANEALRQATAKANFTGSVVQPLIKLTNALAYLAINLVGGYLIIRRGVGVGVVVTIVLYARQFASPLEQLAEGFSQINHVKAAAKRVFAILDMEEEKDLPRQEALRPCRGQVDFEKVTFSYQPKEPLITDLNLSVQPGQKVAIVGPTGAGKTTIVNLLMRFYDPISGRILLDGTDIATRSRAEVREAFGVVLQDTWLFHGTIAENVAYGKPDATQEQIEQVCREAYCDHFIRTMPAGYQTVIGDDAAGLSGGQKQLLTIARALLADRPLLILDEATSNVDTRTELLIQAAMDTLMRGRTCFVIAHRLSTIVDSDQILVLDHGRIVETGTHQSLLEQKGFYYRLYQSQYEGAV